MNPDMQVILDAIHGLGTRIERVEGRLEGVEGRLEGVEGRMNHLESRVETIDLRTNQMAGDLHGLRERVPMLEERIDQGFRALKSDLNFAFSDIRKNNLAQERNEKVIDGLRHDVADLKQRVTALEGTRDAS
jgi:chromosome segregation ATPase